MNKKGVLAIETLISIIIIVAGFLVITGTIFLVSQRAEAKEKEAICRNTVLLSAKTAFTEAAQLKWAPQVCPTIEKEIEGTKEEAKEQFAELLARCWWMFGEGKHASIFDNTAIGGSNKCRVCYIAAVKGEKDFLPGGDALTMAELNTHLAATPYKGTNATYLGYIQQRGRIISLNNIEPQHAYAIAYASRDANENTISALLLGSGAVVGAGAVLLGGPVGIIALSGAAIGAGGAALLQDYAQEKEVSTLFVWDLNRKNQPCVVVPETET